MVKSKDQFVPIELVDKVKVPPLVKIISVPFAELLVIRRPPKELLLTVNPPERSALVEIFKVDPLVI